MNQTELKTLIPALVSAGVMVYEAITGHQVSNMTTSTIVNDAIMSVGAIFTVWGIIQNHQKGV